MYALRARLGSRWEAFFDVVAAVTTVAVLGDAFVNGVPSAYPEWLALSLLGAGAAFLTVRRRVPLVAAVGSIATSAFAVLLPSAIAIWVLAEICLFSLPLRRSRLLAGIVGTAHAVVLYAGALAAFDVAPWDPLALILPVWTGAVVAFGTALRTQQDYVGALEQQARSAAATREIEILRRVGSERLHIARDLHDSVANSLTVINLETTTAARHVEDDPARTRRSLDAIRAVTRSTITELAAILDVLRDDADEADRTVATALNLPSLIDLMAASGLEVQAEVDSLTAVALAPAADAAIYRVAQESLTNAQRHGTGSVRLTTRIDDGTLTLIVDNEIAVPGMPTDSGFGLIGMRERVELAGGTLDTQREGGRFTVRARLPLVTDPAEALG